MSFTRLFPLSARSQLVGVVLLLALAAGCGGSTSSKHARSVPPATTTAAKVRTAYVRELIRDYKTLGADISAMRAAAAPVTKATLMGTPALRRTTNRFLLDLAKSHLTLKEQNREIDHAAGAVSATCAQCFQQLEADRPIPEIAHPH